MNFPPGLAPDIAPRERRPGADQPERLSVETLSHLQRRVVLEAVEVATGTFWLRRAAAFEAARPSPGDYMGQATRADLSRRWRELTEIAAACRSRAAMSCNDPDLSELYDDVIAC